MLVDSFSPYPYLHSASISDETYELDILLLPFEPLILLLSTLTLPSLYSLACSGPGPLRLSMKKQGI